jgi:FAD/FMN-containing dehydrogenase/Fe-S oxidoreductase
MSALNAANCEVAFDNRTRQLYATDASPYQIVPAAVAFPKNTAEAAHLIQAALTCGLPLAPRGGGTGLGGGALGDGVIVDFARHNRAIWDFDKDARTVRVGAGVVLDQLNAWLKPQGLCFGPDVATSSRATLGGMIANNSSGAYTPIYGTTSRHVREIEIVMADGKITRIGSHLETLHRQRGVVEDLLALNSLIITEQFPAGLLKRWPGYALAEALEQSGNLVPILCGSEGTLAGIFSAQLKLVPLPAERGVGMFFFDSVAEAMQSTMELLKLEPVAVEHIDRPLFDQTRGQREFQAVRDLLGLDTQPCEAILLVEFFDGAKDKLAQLAKVKLGRRQLMLKTPRERELVWAMRKAGLSLLTSRKGSAKPATFVEDSAVAPRHLPAYVAGLQELMARVGVEASFYGHAAAGLLHVRPVLDLHSGEDLKKYRLIADEVASLVAQFKGSLAAEHGVGIARTEYLKAQVGAELYRVMREIKAAFDPNNLFNPGKIIGDGRYKIDRHLRQGADKVIALPFEPQLAFAARDESFTANLEQCNGCGGCTKWTPVMCPTYVATGEEGMSTRGRANLIRAALERREIPDALRSEELEYALSNCLSCRACAVECPSNVNLPLLKAELLHARHKVTHRNRLVRMVGSVDFLGRLGCLWPALSNFILERNSVRHLLGRMTGMTDRRPLPEYAGERFDRWFAKHRSTAQPVRGSVILWDDTFVRYHEPHIGQAAVKVLEAAGFGVTLLKKRKCCGRPAFSMGDLDKAKKFGRHNLELLAATAGTAPIIFLEPSCFSMFAEDYRELGLAGAADIAGRCFLFEDFIGELLERDPDALNFAPLDERIVIHAHCHAKALTDPKGMQRLASHMTGRSAVLLDTGCCGMAGSFGMIEEKYDLSVKIAEPLIDKIKQQPYGTTTVVSGTSCRHQVQHLATVKTRHMAEVLADALE